MNSLKIKMDVSVYYNDHEHDVGFRVAGSPLEGISSLEGEGFIAIHEEDDTWVAILCGKREAGSRMAQFNVGAKVFSPMPASCLLSLKQCLEQFDETSVGKKIVPLEDLRMEFPEADRNILAGILECTMTDSIGLIDPGRSLSDETDIMAALSLLMNEQLGRLSIGLPLPEGAEPCDVSLLPDDPDFVLKETLKTTFVIDKDVSFAGTEGDAAAEQLLSVPEEIRTIAFKSNNYRYFEIYDSLINRYEIEKKAGDPQVLYTIIYALRQGGKGKRLLYKMYRSYVERRSRPSSISKEANRTQTGRSTSEESERREKKKKKGWFGWR